MNVIAQLNFFIFFITLRGSDISEKCRKCPILAPMTICACENIFLVHAMGFPICSAFTYRHNQSQKYCQKDMRL